MMCTDSKNPEELVSGYFGNTVDRERKNSERREAFIRACARTSTRAAGADAGLPGTGKKRELNFIEGTAQALLGLAASFLIMVFANTALPGTLAKQYNDPREVQRIGFAFSEMAKQVQENVFTAFKTSE